MTTFSPRFSVPWHAIDTVLLDMDGTLLDLRFDNVFWLELVPERYARERGISLAVARKQLTPLFASAQGTLNWYCTDYWSEQLGFSIAQLKDEVRERVRLLPGAVDFLKQLQRWRKQRYLVTNAHPDTLRIKNSHVPLDKYFDRMISSHDYGAPKEDARFWSALEVDLQFDRERTLFIDDSLNVLRAAREFGITHILSVARPDTGLPERAFDEFAAIYGVADLIQHE